MASAGRGFFRLHGDAVAFLQAQPGKEIGHPRRQGEKAVMAQRGAPGGDQERRAAAGVASEKRVEKVVCHGDAFQDRGLAEADFSSAASGRAWATVPSVEWRSMLRSI